MKQEIKRNLKIDDKKDLLLLLLYAGGRSRQVNEPIVGRTRLVKMIFLFTTETWRNFKNNIELTDDNLYKFFPWNYGPFSGDVYNDITFFYLNGFIHIQQSTEEAISESVEEWNFYLKTNINNDLVPSEYEEESFSLTDKGIRFAETLYNTLSSNQKSILIEFKARLASMPLRSILRYVYKTYPNQTTNSVIKNDILKY